MSNTKLIANPVRGPRSEEAVEILPSLHKMVIQNYRPALSFSGEKFIQMEPLKPFISLSYFLMLYLRLLVKGIAKELPAMIILLICLLNTSIQIVSP